MIIALDYDDTYTKDPLMWDQVIAIFKAMGHTVHCVTFRTVSEGEEVVRALSGKVDKIYCTSRNLKRRFMEDQGIYVDVWIDDQPELIVSYGG